MAQDWVRLQRVLDAGIAVMEQAPFQIEMQVRDYECDMQGIVNNAVYQNYLEWARHKFLRSRGVDFVELTAEGIFVMVIRAELDYKQSLRAGDNFLVSVTTRQISPLKLLFEQEINKLDSSGLVLQANIIAASVNEQKRPCFPQQLKALL